MSYTLSKVLECLVQPVKEALKTFLQASKGTSNSLLLKLPLKVRQARKWLASAIVLHKAKSM